MKGEGWHGGNRQRISRRSSGRLEYRSEENLIGCTEDISHPFWTGYKDVANDTGADFNDAKGSAATAHQTMYKEIS